MTTRAFRAGMAGMVLSLLLSLTGCVKMNMEIGVVPDGSTRGKVVMGVDSALTQGSASTAMFGNLESSVDAAHWKLRQYEEGTWEMAEATGSAPAGQPALRD